MRIALFADLHLDATFKWAPREHARRRRDGLRRTLGRILEVAAGRKVDAILCAGDLFEHERITPDTEEFMRDAFRSVGRTPVYVAPGNHDWWCKGSPYQRLAWSPNVHIFGEESLEPEELTPGLVLWGAAHQRPAGTAGFLEHLRVHDPSHATHVALFHGSHEQSFKLQGDSKQPHAPFREEQIRAVGLTHAFVGHYHTPSVDRDFTYPGNPDPLTFGEDGERGVVIAEIGQDGSVIRETVKVATTRLGEVVVDVTGISHRDDILDQVREAAESGCEFVRVTLTGELSPSIDLRHSDVHACLGDGVAVVVRRRDLRTAYDLGAIAREPTVRGQFVEDVQRAGLPDEETRRVLTIGLRALEGRTDLEVL